MGWNTYYGIGGTFDEKTIREVADVLIDTGLASAGYDIVWLDAGWASGARDAAGDIIIDPQQWPNGLKGLTDYLHSRGLRAGIYSDAGPGSHNELGSKDHYQQDADAFARWGFDAVKIDFVWGGKRQLDPVPHMTEFAQAVRHNSSNRPMIINICNFWLPGHMGNGYPTYERSSHNAWSWAPAAGDSWRTDSDVGFSKSVVFENVLRNMDRNAAHPEVAGPGKWNDPDYLAPELGMTATEARTQMTMWAMMAAPLVIGSDVRRLSAPSIAMLKNAEVLAVDQDALGIQGGRIRQKDGLEVWVKPLANGDRAVALLNRTNAPSRIAFTPREIGFNLGRRHEVKDLWTGSKKTVRQFSGATVPAHGAVLYRVTPGRAASLGH